jgi:hypothetical protein
MTGIEIGMPEPFLNRALRSTSNVFAVCGVKSSIRLIFAAHVVGEHSVAAVAVGEVCGEDRPAGRPGLDEPHRKRRGGLDGHQTTAGVDEV